MITSRRESPTFPVFESVTGRADTESKKESNFASRADSADERARPCENAYRARRVSFGRTISGIEAGRDVGSSGGGLEPRIMRSPWIRVFLSYGVRFAS